MMKKIIIFVVLTLSFSVFSDGAFVTMSLGPDIPVKEATNAYNSARFRMNMELGSRNFTFLIQPSFGNSVSAVFVGGRFMYPIPIGDAPLFFVPDFGAGVDLGFDGDTMGVAMDTKLGIRIFYEFYESMALVIRPVGLNIRFFNIWMGDRANQTSVSINYELQFGFTYFF